MKSQDTFPGPDEKGENGRKPGRLSRLWKWIDERTGVDQALRRSLDEPIPGGARFAYVFGSALLFIFVSQIVTGVCLALYYVPAPQIAHTSVAYIVKEVAGGSFLRSLHSYGSSAMVVVLVLHFLQTVFFGAYKGKRQLLWVSGCVLGCLVLAMAFTGYLLSWDQSAYSAGSVGTNIVGQVPFVGESLRRLLRGGAEMGALTLSRFYVLHVLLIPALLFMFVASHLILFRKAGPAGPVGADPVSPRLPTQPFYPKQVLIDLAFVLSVMGVLGMLAHFVPVTLGLEADPSNTTYLPRPEWYFLPMFQWLKYWEGWRTVIGVFILPVILVGLVFALPFMDRGPERRPWRRPIPVGAVLIVVLGAIWLGMTSRLADSRDPILASQLAQQRQEEEAFSHASFQPLLASAPDGGGAPASGDVTVAQGKGIFDSHGCSGCHGASGGGGKGPALTHIASKYQPAHLTALLKAPTAPMKAAGMVALTLDPTEMAALVSYLDGLGGGLGGPVAAAPSSGSPPATTTAAGASPVAKGGAGTAGAVPGKALSKAAPGEASFKSLGCASCHGAAGVGTQRAPALTSLGQRMSAAQMSSLLRAPSAKMTAGGMPPVTASGHELTSLVAYLRSLGSGGGQKDAGTATAASTPAQPVSPPPKASSPADGGLASTPPSGPKGEALFKEHGCPACHGAGGVGTSRGPALTKATGTITSAGLTRMLDHPTAAMKSGGMPPVKIPQQDMTALVAYLRGLGGAAGKPPAKGVPPSTPMDALASRGEAVFRAHRCAGCHGTNGVGGTSAAPALAGTGASLSPAALTSMLEHPTTPMHRGGMPPVSLSAGQMKALVAYLSHISSTTAR